MTLLHPGARGVVITIDIDEGLACFTIATESATYPTASRPFWRRVRPSVAASFGPTLAGCRPVPSVASLRELA
jgi:hypothetical protein